MNEETLREEYLLTLTGAYQTLERRNQFVNPSPNAKEREQAQNGINTVIKELQQAHIIAGRLNFSSHQAEIQTIYELLSHPSGRDFDQMLNQAVTQLAIRVDQVQEYSNPENYPDGYHAFISRHLAKLLEQSIRLLQKLMH